LPQAVAAEPSEKIEDIPTLMKENPTGVDLGPRSLSEDLDGMVRSGLLFELIAMVLLCPFSFFVDQALGRCGKLPFVPGVFGLFGGFLCRNHSLSSHESIVLGFAFVMLYGWPLIFSPHLLGVLPENGDDGGRFKWGSTTHHLLVTLVAYCSGVTATAFVAYFVVLCRNEGMGHG
jgi:hypothetical protein